MKLQEALRTVIQPDYRRGPKLVRRTAWAPEGRALYVLPEDPGTLDGYRLGRRVELSGDCALTVWDVLAIDWEPCTPQDLDGGKGAAPPRGLFDATTDTGGLNHGRD